MIDWQEAYATLMALCNERDAEIERLRAINAELLAALKTCLPHIEPIAADKYEIARAVIQKAEGHD